MLVELLDAGSDRHRQQARTRAVQGMDDLRDLRQPKSAALGSGGHRREDDPRSVVEDDPPLVDHHEAVDQFRKFVDVMLDHDDRHRPLAVKAVDDLEDVPHALRIQVRRRLVKHDDLRFQGQHRGKADSLLLSAGEAHHLRVEVGEHADLFQRGVSHVTDVSRIAAQILQAEIHLVAHGLVDDLGVRVLEDHPDGGGHGGHRCIDGRTPFDEDLASELAGHEVGNATVHRQRQRRLSGSGRPHDEDPLAAAHDEVDSVENGPGRPVGCELHFAQLEDRLTCHLSAPYSSRRSTMVG